MAQEKGNEFVRMAAHHGPVRITIPANVAFNFDRFTKMLGGIAERLGCRPCLSGAACLFVLERDYVVNPELGIEAVHNSDPLPILPGGSFGIKG